MRPAEPGEFSRRAFLAGKLDLTRAEGIADLVEAETAAQRRQALRQMGGALAAIIDGWRARLLRARAHLEAEIDFAEEGLPQELGIEARNALTRLADEMGKSLADQRRGERLRDGFQVVLLGPPNVGKSSIINRIAGRDAAIVAASAGTTRDVIEVHLDLGGFPITIADTAGLREAEGRCGGRGDQTLPPSRGAGGLAPGGFSTRRRCLRLTPKRVRCSDHMRSRCSINATWPEAPCLNRSMAQSFSISPPRRARLRCAACDHRLQGFRWPGSRGCGRADAGAAPGGGGRGGDGFKAGLARDTSRTGGGRCKTCRGCAWPNHTGRIDVEEMLDVIFREFCIGK